VKLTIYPFPVLRPRLSGLFFYSLIYTQTTIYHNKNHYFFVYIFEIMYWFIKVMCLLLQLTTYLPVRKSASQPVGQSVSQSVILTHTHSHSILLAHSLAHSLTRSLPNSLSHSFTHTLIYWLIQSLLLVCCLKKYLEIEKHVKIL
jgi:hypothetical protein